MKFCTLVALSLVSLMLANEVFASPPALSITNVVIVDEDCDQANGGFTVDHDGMAPFLYFLNGVGTGSNTLTGLSSGNYTFKIIDGGAFEAETTLVVNENFAPVLALQSSTDASCSMGGSATVSIVSGDPDATASWDSNPAQTGFDLVDVPGGTYTITVTDSAGCEAQLAIPINSPGTMVLNTTSTQDTCRSGDGTATVSVQLNGTSPFSYQWDNKAGSQTTATATGLLQGTYNVVVTDAAGCTSSQDITVRLIKNLAVAYTVDDATCYRGNDASIDLMVTGGNGTYTYEWSPNVGNSRVIDSLQAGTYTVIVSDAEGTGTSCVLTETIIVGEAPKINPRLERARTSGCGEKDGQARVNPLNTQGPYTVLWDTLGNQNAFQIGDTAFNLYPGIYEYRLTDSAGCSVKDRFVLESKNGISVKVEILQEDDCGLGEGIAKANLVGGTRPFRYTWFTRSEQPTDRDFIARNLEQGAQLVVVSDINDCVKQDAFTVPGNEPLEVKNKFTTKDYCELSNGTALATFKGGTPPYTYLWNTLPLQTAPTATGLEKGFYRVAIRDVLGCRDTAELYVDPKEAFELSTEKVDISCFGRQNGEVSVKVSNGGNAPFSYIWNTSPVQNAASLTQLAEGTYTVVVTDARGCQRNASAVVENQSPIVADFTYEPDTINPLYLGSSVVAFKNLSEGGHHYRWRFGDDTRSEIVSPTHQYVDTGSFVVTLTVFNEDESCQRTVKHGPFRVRDKSTAFVANAFTPNGDGFNDHLTFTGQLVDQFTITIFNRWGAVVYTAFSIEDRWDGTLKNGQAAPEGVYMYVLKSIGIDGQTTESLGTVTLIR